MFEAQKMMIAGKLTSQQKYVFETDKLYEIKDEAYENAVKRGAVKRIVGGFYKNSPSVKSITSGTFIRDVYVLVFFFSNVH